MFKIFFSYFLFSTLIANQVEAKIIFKKNCSEAVKSTLLEAVPEVLTNLEEISSEKYSYKHTIEIFIGSEISSKSYTERYKMNLTEQEKRRIYDRIMREDLIVSCPKSESLICWTPNGAAGGKAIAHNMLFASEKVALCGVNEYVLPFDKCDLLQIFFHELGHMANLPIAKYHNKWNSPKFERRLQEDKVYQFGNAVEQFCIDKLE